MGRGWLRIVEGHKPDLAICDVRLPPTFTDEGIRAALEARRRHPQLAGRTALDREVVSLLVRKRHSAAADTGIDGLTARERETLELIAQGRSNAAIARELVVTPGAVEKPISNIFGKLDLPATDDDHRRVLAMLTYLGATGA